MNFLQYLAFFASFVALAILMMRVKEYIFGWFHAVVFAGIGLTAAVLLGFNPWLGLLLAPIGGALGYYGLWLVLVFLLWG